MAFFKFRARGPQANEGRSASIAAAPAESVEAMRRRARHRLVGAAVLVLLGVIGFPLLFDTQPRPVAVDIPIEIPDRSKTRPLALPTPAASAPTVAAASPGERVAPSSSGMITERADGTELPEDKPVLAPLPESPRAPVASVVPEPAARPKPELKVETTPEKPEHRTDSKPATPAATPVKPTPSEDGARARALLEGKPATAAAAAAAKPAAAADDSGRFVVQVGAFADADKAREVRQKLERAGLKTYTNVAKTAEGERTRVRVGPFSSRAEADRAASKVKGLSLPAAVLTL